MTTQSRTDMEVESTEQRTALVTGGAGFIGSHLVDRLLSSGYTVICVDNFILGRREHLDEAMESPAFSLEEFDRRVDQRFWKGLRDVLPTWDEMIEEFNARTGV